MLHLLQRFYDLLKANSVAQGLLLLLFLAANDAQAQTNVLSPDAFLQAVQANHPMAKQADLLINLASARTRAARGAFDPKIAGDYAQKQFSNTRYYEYGELGVKWPTSLYGLQVKTGYNFNGGQYLDPSDRLPAQGQAVIGFSMPLLQGFMLDEGRSELRQSQLGQQAQEAEAIMLRNDLALQATEAYWKWAFTYQETTIFNQALMNAQNRFVGVRTAFELGDRMGMDTLESFTQVQDRTIQYNEVLLEYISASYKLNNFVWPTNNAQMDTSVTPVLVNNWPTINISPDERTALSLSISQNHPIVTAYNAKLDQLDVDRRLKREKLKPELRLDYNVLGKGLAVNDVFVDNYKFGITFQSSTLFRQARGQVEMAQLKMNQTNQARDLKVRELENKLREALAELDLQQQQIATYTAAVENYRKLLELEQRRFVLGESSFFLINSRENKYLEAQIKLAKQYSAYQVARATVYWVAGRLAQ
jgi:outer membrane protein TolC